MLAESTFQANTLTLIIAVSGLVLGIVNTWRTIHKDRVRIRVRPVQVYCLNDEERLVTGGVGVSVTNLSSFEITITELGFMKRWKNEKISLFGTDLGHLIPCRMLPRTTISFRIPESISSHPNFVTVHRPFVDTACGKRFTGSSPAWRSFRKRIRKMR